MISINLERKNGWFWQRTVWVLRRQQRHDRGLSQARHPAMAARRLTNDWQIIRVELD